jgi:hypothetical protein
VEPSSAISDSELNHVAGGNEIFDFSADTDIYNKVIFVKPDYIEALDIAMFRNEVINHYSKAIQDGFQIVFTTQNTKWGKQIK